MQTPLVTVGITCFNARDTLERAVRSAQRQVWPSIEIIVVDDCSEDGSQQALAELISGDSRARLIKHEENLGVGAARNTIVGASCGEFIAFFDDDDESLPNRISAQMRTLREHEDHMGSRLVACYAGGERIYDNGYRVDAPAIGTCGDIPHGAAMVDYLLAMRKQPRWFYGSGVPACALLARRATFQEMGGFDPKQRRLEDADFAIRLALAGGYFVGTPERLYIRHMTGGSDKSAQAIFDSQVYLAQKYRNYLRSVGLYRYALHWPRLRYWHFKRRYGRFALELLMLLMSNPIAVSRHLCETGPARLFHEGKIRSTQQA
jgi:glycosyltransferase involved in cell wall biosynthesis